MPCVKAIRNHLATMAAVNAQIAPRKWGPSMIWWIIGGVVLVALAAGILWLRPWVDDYSEIHD